MHSTVYAPEDAAREAVKRPDSYAYFGDLPLFDTWGFSGVSTHRDADALTRTNWEAITEDLQGTFPEDFEVVGSSHWAVGWVDQLAVRVYTDDGEITEAFLAVLDWREKLDAYPVADEEAFSEAEMTEALETIEACAPINEVEINGVLFEALDELPEDWASRVFGDRDHLWHPDSIRAEDVETAMIDEGFLQPVPQPVECERCKRTVGQFYLPEYYYGCRHCKDEEPAWTV